MRLSSHSATFFGCLLLAVAAWGCQDAAQKAAKVNNCTTTSMKAFSESTDIVTLCKKVRAFLEKCVRPALSDCPELHETVMKKIPPNNVKLIESACGPGSFDISLPTTIAEPPTSATIAATSPEWYQTCDTHAASQCIHGFQAMMKEKMRGLYKENQESSLASIVNIREICRFVGPNGDNITQCVQHSLRHCTNPNVTQNTVRSIRKYVDFCQQAKACPKLNQMSDSLQTCHNELFMSYENKNDKDLMCKVMPKVICCADRSLQYCPKLRKSFRYELEQSADKIRQQCPKFTYDFLESSAPNHLGIYAGFLLAGSVLVVTL